MHLPTHWSSGSGSPGRLSAVVSVVLRLPLFAVLEELTVQPDVSEIGWQAKIKKTIVGNKIFIFHFTKPCIYYKNKKLLVIMCVF